MYNILPLVEVDIKQVSENSCKVKVPQRFYLIVALPTTAGQLILQKKQLVKVLKRRINEFCLCLKEKGTAVSSNVSLFSFTSLSKTILSDTLYVINK